MKNKKLLFILFILAGCSQTIKDTDQLKLSVSIKDMTPPTIVLKKDIVSIEVGESFNPKDYITVDDNYDKDISYTIVGNVNTKVVGKYLLKISCKDKTGNASNKNLVVNVNKKKSEIPNVPVTGTNEDKDINPPKSNQDSDSSKEIVSDKKPVQTKHPLIGKRYMYVNGYNQITASQACNSDLISYPGSGVCKIIFGTDGIDIGMQLE